MEVLQETYKDTKIGRIPKDWEVVKITDVIDLIHGHQFRDYDFVEKGIPIVKIGSLIDGKGIRFDNATFVDSNKLNEFKSYLLKEGDILMALTGATLGKVSKVNTNKIILQNYRVGKFVPKSDSINNIFLYDILQSYLVQNKMWALINQGAQPNIGKADFRLIYIPLPPLPEQQKIAAILSTLDEQISTADKIIEKSKELKKGLMQKLFSEGIQHTEFKDTKIGRIPEDWEVVKLVDVMSVLKSGLSRMLSSEDIGIPVIRSTNIKDHQMDFTDMKYWYSIDPKGANTNSYILENGDLLINFINSMAHIGKSAIYFDELNRDVIYTTNILRLRLNNKINDTYFFNITQTKLYNDFISKITKPSVNQASFTTKDFRNFRFPLPPLTEQQKIAAILSEADAKIEKEQTQKSQLEALKKGLMQQLLTGKKRVKV